MWGLVAVPKPRCERALGSGQRRPHLLDFQAMSFTVRLSSDLITAEAGSSAPVAVDVANRSEDADRFELEIEGLDPEWTAVPVPSFAVEAGEQASEKVFLKPPRTSESLAGNYPFVVKIRSLVSGDARTVQGVLQVKPYNHISMEINPKKGFVSVTRKDNGFEVTLINLGTRSTLFKCSAATRKKRARSLSATNK